MSRNDFLATNKLPTASRYTQEDWELLAQFWHPVARVQDIMDRPVEVTLLDKSLVVFATDNGIHIADNHCPHRGAKLSLGSINGNHIVCPYHGLHFDYNGTCSHVPSIGDESARPIQMNIEVFPAEERYGLVWTCLRQPAKFPIPKIDALESDDFEVFQMEPELWNCSALRHCENFNDTAHIPFVHDGTFGHSSSPTIPAYKILETEQGMQRSITMMIDPRITAEEGKASATEATFNYEYFFPFCSAIEIVMPGDMGSDYIMDTVSPVSATKSQVFQVKARSFSRAPENTPPIAVYQAMVNNEDRPIVESQYPQKVPLDPRLEKHIPADRWSITYRKRWRALGLDRAAPSA